MALYANDRDVLETLLYRRLQTLWHDCTDALAVFTKHRAGTELCGQKVWEALLTAFPLNHQRMQTVLLATEFGNLMAWDGHSKADVDCHFSNVSDTLEMLTFLDGNIDITDECVVQVVGIKVGVLENSLSLDATVGKEVD